MSLVLLGSVAILIGVAIGRRRLGSWWIPLLAGSALAVVLSAGMLVIALDLGTGVDCPDNRCWELTPDPA